MQEPKTIEELKQWYIDRNLPPENVTRFFIGKDYKRPKAFGIYKDEATGKYIVYKNKANGSRAIRYEGENEAYAVNELYKKLKYEIYHQKNNNPRNINVRSSDNNERVYNGKSIKLISPMAIIGIIFTVMIMLIILLSWILPKEGYYNYNDDYYYYQSGSWYQYGGYSWEPIKAPQTLKDDYSNYYVSNDYMYSYGIDNFKYSEYYEEPSSSSSSDYDSDYDWDYDYDWDSDYTDWDSDW